MSNVLVLIAQHRHVCLNSIAFVFLNYHQCLHVRIVSDLYVSELEEDVFPIQKSIMLYF